jgi:hypothetical protein
VAGGSSAASAVEGVGVAGGVTHDPFSVSCVQLRCHSVCKPSSFSQMTGERVRQGVRLLLLL